MLHERQIVKGTYNRADRKVEMVLTERKNEDGDKHFFLTVSEKKHNDEYYASSIDARLTKDQLGVFFEAIKKELYPEITLNIDTEKNYIGGVDWAAPLTSPGHLFPDKVFPTGGIVDAETVKKVADSTHNRQPIFDHVVKVDLSEPIIPTGPLKDGETFVERVQKALEAQQKKRGR